jgi:hypothetical protein
MTIYRSRPQVQISAAPERAAAGEVQTLQMLSKQTAAAATTDSQGKQGTVIAERGPTLAALIIFIFALVVSVPLLFGTKWGPAYTPAAGVGAFALFYIAAQAAERAVEFLLPAIGKIDSMDKPTKAAKRDLMIAMASEGTESAQNTPNAKAAADAQAEVDQVVANRRIVAFAVTAALGMLLCSYLEADFLTAVGVNFDSDPWWAQAVQMGVTGLVVGGGSVGLHDLIGNITKSSKAKDDPEETGGTK